MAYDPTQLSALSYANGFTLWHYRTDDQWDKVIDPGYFNSAASMLRAGDMIIVNCKITDFGYLDDQEDIINPYNDTVFVGSNTDGVVKIEAY